MTLAGFYALIEEILELDPKSVRGDQPFRDLEGWDSMAVLNFIAMMDEQFEIVISPKDLAACVVVDDLARLAKEAVGN